MSLLLHRLILVNKYLDDDIKVILKLLSSWKTRFSIERVSLCLNDIIHWIEVLSIFERCTELNHLSISSTNFYFNREVDKAAIEFIRKSGFVGSFEIKQW